MNQLMINIFPWCCLPSAKGGLLFLTFIEAHVGFSVGCLHIFTVIIIFSPPDRI